MICICWVLLKIFCEVFVFKDVDNNKCIDLFMVYI